MSNPIYECDICQQEFTNDDGVICQSCNTNDERMKRYKVVEARAEAFEEELKTTERLRTAGIRGWAIAANKRDALAAELDKARGELTEWHKQYHRPNITHPDWCESWPSGKGRCTCGAQSLSHPSGEREREIMAELERLRGTVEALEIYRDIEYARAMKELDPTVQTYDQLADQNEKLRKMVLWGLGVIPTSNRRWRDAACKLLDALAVAGKQEKT